MKELQPITKAICNKGFSGNLGILLRSNFGVGGQVSSPQSLTAYSLNVSNNLKKNTATLDIIIVKPDDMYKIFLYFLLAISLFSACNNGNATNAKSEKKTDDFDDYIQEIRNNKKIYQKAMADKGIKLTINGPCDDALEDTIHERAKAYIDTIKIGSEILVTFRFIEACCQEYLANYEIRKDTMVIDLAKINEEECACLCWYQYRYEVKKNKSRIKYIRIKDI